MDAPLARLERNRYPSATLLSSSVGRSWSDLHVELRAHPAGPVVASRGAHMEVAVVLQGSAVVGWSAAGTRQRVHVERGSVWINSPGVEQDSSFSQPLPGVLHLFLSEALLRRLAAQMGRPEEQLRSFTSVRDPLIEAIGAAVLQELQSATVAGDGLVESLATALAARLLSSYPPVPGPLCPAARTRGSLSRSRLQRVLQFIDERLEVPVTVGELAAVAHLSEFYFSRAFKWATGQSPMCFVVARRLTRASAWLAENDKTLLEIAHRHQFATYGSFSRAFVRAMGMTPAQFRKRQR
jgi:AraC family transcriptional regulator